MRAAFLRRCDNVRPEKPINRLVRKVSPSRTGVFMPTKRRLPQWAIAIALAVSPAAFAFADEPQKKQPSAEQPVPGQKPAPIEKPVKAPEKSDKPSPMPAEPPPPVERKLPA